MGQVTEQQVLDALKCIVDPERGKDIVSLGMVQGLRIKEGHVVLALEVDPKRGPQLEPLRKQVETLVHKLPGVITASVVLTAERQAAAPPPPQRAASSSPGGASDRWRAVTGGRGDRCRRVRQGRRRQVHHGGESGAGAGQARPSHRTARRRHLRSVDAPAARHYWPARIERRRQARPHGEVRHQGDVDGVSGRGGHADRLARADGAVGAGADDARCRLGIPRCHGRRHAARAPATRS